MLKRGGWAIGIGLLLAGCAAAPGPKKQEILIVAADSASGKQQDADVQQVMQGVQMVAQGKIQAAIDGPFDDVAKRYESQYGKSGQVVYSARGMTDALVYAALPDKSGGGASVTVLGPAWAMAYWGRGYAYNEMARYDDAIAELQKALALAPLDAQYHIEIGYAYQRKSAWDLSLQHFRTAQANAAVTVPEREVAAVTCSAWRGEGYDLVEMHRYEEAREAYRACLKLVPDEPKSLGELKYIDRLQQGRTSG